MVCHFLSTSTIFYSHFSTFLVDSEDEEDEDEEEDEEGGGKAQKKGKKTFTMVCASTLVSTVTALVGVIEKVR